MNIKIKLSIIVLLFSIFTSKTVLPAQETTVIDTSLPFDIQYTDSAYPGDIVYITLIFDKTVSNQFYAQVDLYAEGVEDVLYRAELYEVGEKSFFAMIPLSSWYSTGAFYLELSYQIANGEKKRFELPITMKKKDFVSETLYLDARNTAIKTDTSTKRVTQIDRLNTILSRVDYTGVYLTDAFTYPLEKIYHTSFFGDRRVYEYTTGASSTSVHYGIDYRAATGTPVYASGRGKVVMAEERISTGFTVVLEHLPGLYGLYYHLDSYSVSEGQIIEQGEQIGESGATGLVTGPHLHWEVRLLGLAVDPEFLMGQ